MPLAMTGAIVLLGILAVFRRQARRRSRLGAGVVVLLVAGLGPDEVRTEAQLRQLLAEQSRWIGVGE